MPGRMDNNTASGFMRRLWRLAWAAPWTLLGLALGGVMLAQGGRVRRVQGVLEISGGRLGAWAAGAQRPGGVVAITFGHVVLGTGAAVLDALRAHERVHVRQYERWGVFFVPAYLASSALQWLRGGDPYRDNRFEREARALEPGSGVAGAPLTP
jgi:hypothetical protein